MSDRLNPAQLFGMAWPHLLAIAVLMIIAGTFYSKSFDGYQLRMPDIEHSIATSKEVNDHRSRTGEQALWTDSQFGGMPTIQLGMRTSDVNAGSWLGRFMFSLLNAKRVRVLTPISAQCLTIFRTLCTPF